MGLRARLGDTVRAFRGLRVLVLGDPILDVYTHGTTHRISREAPVLIVREESVERRLGGAANTAANLVSLGADVAIAGIVGDDDAAGALDELLRAKGVDPSGLVRAPDRKTVTKTRILAGAVHTTKQQMLRIDRENDGPPGADAIASLRDRFAGRLGDRGALVVADYGDGRLGPTYAELARAAQASGRVVAVDSRFDLPLFHGVTVITPNEAEAEAAFGLRLGTDELARDQAAQVRRAMGLTAMVLTRGNQGMAVADAERAALIPRHGPPEAVDVTGAGDTVTAAIALSLAAGASILEAGILANLAASITVQRVGVAQTTEAELLAGLEGYDLSPFGGER